MDLKKNTRKLLKMPKKQKSANELQACTRGGRQRRGVSFVDLIFFYFFLIFKEEDFYYIYTSYIYLRGRSCHYLYPSYEDRS